MMLTAAGTVAPLAESLQVLLETETEVEVMFDL